MITKEKYYFDKAAADKVIKFIETYVTHVKGELANRTIKLEDWQKNDIIRPLFGWKNSETKLRRYRTCYVEIPRKNAKSTLAAGIGLYLLMSDGEPGAEIYSAAADRGQAGIVFNVAKSMIDQNMKLSEIAKPYRNSIVYKSSFYQAISADANTKHGFNAHGIIFDELHTQPNRELYDVLTTSVGSRRQPIVLLLTTAGHDRNSICWEMHEYARKVNEGIIKDESFLGVIYSAEQNDDIFDKKTWKKANPGYGSIVKESYIKDQANVILNNPSFENTFRRLHLNQWTTSETKWISDIMWMACDKGELPDLTGQKCWAGLDLASKSDTTCLLLLFEYAGDFCIMPFFFMPKENISERMRKSLINYDEWVKAGFIIETPGNVTDYDYIKAKIKQLAETYQIQSIEYDRWNSSQLVIDLGNDGLKMRGFGQGYSSMSTPTKEIEGLVLQKRLSHAGNPVLRWQCSNAMTVSDPAGNIKIDKSKSKEKVDGMVTLVMAYGGYLTDQASNAADLNQIYSERGIKTI